MTELPWEDLYLRLPYGDAPDARALRAQYWLRHAEGQTVPVAAIATVIAASAAIVLDLLLPPGSIPLAVTPARLGTSALLLVGAAVAGCSFSLRRVLKVDPASAIGTVQ